MHEHKTNTKQTQKQHLEKIDHKHIPHSLWATIAKHFLWGTIAKLSNKKPST